MHRLARLAATVAALIMLTVAGLASPAAATTTGAKWHRLHLYVWNGTGYPAVPTAAGDWSHWRTGARLYVQPTAYETYAQIRVFWKDLPAPVVGTAASPMVGNQYVGVCIVSLSPALRHNYNLMRAVASHEIGHCLGLAHSDPFLGSVMYSGARSWLYRPTWYDNRDLVRIYGRL